MKCNHPGGSHPVAWACAECGADWGAVDELREENAALRAALEYIRDLPREHKQPCILKARKALGDAS